MSQVIGEDIDFRLLSHHSTPELIVAGWYEYARESQTICDTLKAWLQCQKLRSELTAHAKRLRIDVPHLIAQALHCDKRLPKRLWEECSEMVSNEHAVQKIESRGGRGAPRLRLLASYIVDDKPWLLVPQTHRDVAIKHALKTNVELPADADGASFFVPLHPVQRVWWSDFEPPKFSEDEIARGEDSKFRKIHFREASRGVYSGDEELVIRIRWGLFNNNQIVEAFAKWVKGKNARPKEFKSIAKGSGHHRQRSWWWAALKELSALRLVHEYAPEKARRIFSRLYGKADSSLDESNFRKLRRQSIATFQYLFDTKEEPRHLKTWSQRQHRSR